MIGRLFGKSRIWYKDDELLIIRYASREGDFYVGSFDTQEGFVETRHTLEAVARQLEHTPHFPNYFLSLFERLKFGVMHLEYPCRVPSMEPRTVFFDRSPSMLFASSLPPFKDARTLRAYWYSAKYQS